MRATATIPHATNAQRRMRVHAPDGNLPSGKIAMRRNRQVTKTMSGAGASDASHGVHPAGRGPATLATAMPSSAIAIIHEVEMSSRTQAKRFDRSRARTNAPTTAAIESPMLSPVSSNPV